MFKATNKQRNEEVVILDPKWSSQLHYLRQLDRNDELVCPGCQQPVRVRAGQERRWHFAHKQLQDCPLSHEAAIVLEARAVLYEWLVGKFQEGAVTLEKKSDSDLLPRPIDCWVQTKWGQVAYWIIPSQVKPAQREALKLAFEQQAIPINWVFLSDMLREDQDEVGQIHLTTTEREFLQPSEYNEFIDQSGDLRFGFSLHYLDPTPERLITFRTLQVVHPPQLYGGRKQAHPMGEVLVHPKTGEFVHPGEFEYLQRTQKERARIKQKWEELERQRREQQVHLMRLFGLSSPNVRNEMISRRPRSVAGSEETDRQEGVCILCGETKNEWGFIGEEGNRICRDCYGT